MGNLSTKEWWGKLFSKKGESTPTPTPTPTPSTPTPTPTPTQIADAVTNEKKKYDKVAECVDEVYIDWVKDIKIAIKMRNIEATNKINNAGIVNSTEPCSKQLELYKRYISRVALNKFDGIDADIGMIISDLNNCYRQCLDKQLAKLTFSVPTASDLKSKFFNESLKASESKRRTLLTNRYYYTVRINDSPILIDYIDGEYDPDMSKVKIEVSKTDLSPIIKQFATDVNAILVQVKTDILKKYSKKFTDSGHEVYINTVYEFNPSGKMGVTFDVLYITPSISKTRVYDKKYAIKKKDLISMSTITAMNNDLTENFNTNKSVIDAMAVANDKYSEFVNKLGGLDAYNKIKTKRMSIEAFSYSDYNNYKTYFTIIVILILLYVLYRRLYKGVK
jgi:hypothetical protein